jgi:hypothetical protein
MLSCHAGDDWGVVGWRWKCKREVMMSIGSRQGRLIHLSASVSLKMDERQDAECRGLVVAGVGIL